MLEAEVTTAGDVLVEGQHIGHLQGFQFAPDAEAEGQNGGQDVRTLRAAAQNALGNEIETRAERFSSSADDTFVLANDGIIRWNGDSVGKLIEGEKLLSPGFRLLADDSLAAGAREKVETRLSTWLKAHVTKQLGSLNLLESAEEITGPARSIALQIVESLGVLERSRVAQDVKTLDQESRSALRRHGVRFGAFHLYIPQLLKPAPRALAAQLWALKNGSPDQPGLDDIAHLASSGRTSFKLLPDVAKGLYRAAGFRVCGERVLRVDILERLADLIRPAIAYKPGVTPGEPPAGTADGDGFVVTVAMTSLAGCAGEDFASILKSLGYNAEKRMGPPITAELLPAPRLIAAPASADGTEAAPTLVDAAPQSEEAESAESASADTMSVEAPIVAAADASEAPIDAVSEESAPAQDAAAEITVEQDAPAQTATDEIEIWRPHRHQHAPRQGQNDRRGRGAASRGQQHNRQGAADAADQTPGDASGAPRESHGRQERHQRLERFGGSPRPRTGGSEGGGSEERTFNRNRGRHAHPGAGKGHGASSHGKSWQDRKGSAPRADRAPDPDSPFAKLAALKQALERGNDKD